MATRKAKTKTTETVLILRTCAPGGISHNGFTWPLEVGAQVEAPDWDAEPRCGGGLHGLLWGEGDGTFLNWQPDAVWIVWETDARGVVDIDRKVKARRGVVRHVGDQQSATTYLAEHGGAGRVIVGGTATAGYSGTATAGDRGTATAGDSGTATAGDSGTATAGYRGTATAGYSGTATAGYSGTATAGYRGTATAGDSGTATAGYSGTATAGEDGVIAIKWWDEKAQKLRQAIGVVGQNGIEPNTPYRCVDGQLVKVEAKP